MEDSGKVKGKQFFFEKKNQKTFAPETTHVKPARAKFAEIFAELFLKSDRFASFT